MSKVSVIVPVFNVEKYLSRCIDSILAQTFTDFELILVNDGSTDNSGMICDDYARKHHNVTAIHQPNTGASAARNRGIEYALHSNGCQWIGFIDSDDWISPRYLETMIEAAKKTDCRTIICGYQKTNGKELVTSEKKQAGMIINAENYIFENDIRAVVPWGKLYNRELFRDIRYPVGKICEDEYVTYKILLESGLVFITDEPLYAYYQNPQSVMNAGWSVARLAGVEAHCERYEFLMQHYPQLADAGLVMIWKDCRYQGQMSMLNSASDEQNIVFEYLNGVMKQYRLPWRLVRQEKPKEIVWLSLQKVHLRMVCRIRNKLSIGM